MNRWFASLFPAKPHVPDTLQEALGRYSFTLELLRCWAARDRAMCSKGLGWKQNQRALQFKTTLSRPNKMCVSDKQEGKNRKWTQFGVVQNHPMTGADTLPCTCASTPTSRTMLRCCLGVFFPEDDLRRERRGCDTRSPGGWLINARPKSGRHLDAQSPAERCTRWFFQSFAGRWKRRPEVGGGTCYGRRSEKH